MPKKKTEPGHLIELRQYLYEAKTRFALARLGDHLAALNGYKEPKGLDAVYYYLVQKHDWLPSQVRCLDTNELNFLLDSELVDFKFDPPEKLTKILGDLDD